ncbi:hypothetical protein D3C75_1221580 [compost metagenome]
MNLGLLGNPSIRIKEMRYIIELTVAAQHVGSPNNMDVVFPGIPGEHVPVLFSKLRQVFNT